MLWVDRWLERWAERHAADPAALCAALERDAPEAELPELGRNERALLRRAWEVAPAAQIALQATLQAQVDGAVSRTIHLPRQTEPREIARLIRLAHGLGCKGVALYRRGSHEPDVLRGEPAPELELPAAGLSEPAQRCGRAHAFEGERNGGVAWGRAGAPRGLEHSPRVRRDLLADRLERLALGAAVVLDGGADHAAGVRDEVGHHHDAARVQRRLGVGRDRDVRALEDQARSEAADVRARDHVGASRGDPDLAGHVDHRLGGALLAAGMLDDAAPRVAQRAQAREVEAGRVVDGPL